MKRKIFALEGIDDQEVEIVDKFELDDSLNDTINHTDLVEQELNVVQEAYSELATMNKISRILESDKLDNSSIQLAKITLESIYDKLGMPCTPLTVSKEDNSNIALEFDIVGKAKKIGKAIIEAILRLKDHIVNFARTFLQNLTPLKKKLEEMKSQIKNLEHDISKEINNPSLAKQLSDRGHADYSSVTTIIENQVELNKIGMILVEVSGRLLEEWRTTSNNSTELINKVSNRILEPYVNTVNKMQGKTIVGNKMISTYSSGTPLDRIQFTAEDVSDKPARVLKGLTKSEMEHIIENLELLIKTHEAYKAGLDKCPKLLDKIINSFKATAEQTFYINWQASMNKLRSIIGKAIGPIPRLSFNTIYYTVKYIDASIKVMEHDNNHGQ